MRDVMDEIRGLVGELIALDKAAGGVVNAAVTFQHRGAGIIVDLGMGFAPAAGSLNKSPAYANEAWWSTSHITLNPDVDWVTYTYTFAVTLPSSAPNGKRDVWIWLQTVGGTHNLDGTGYLNNGTGYLRDRFTVWGPADFQALDATIT